MHDGTAPAVHGPDATPDERTVFVDGDGLLRYGGRWVAVTDTQLPVVELLVRRLGSLVRNEDLLEAHKAGGGVGTDAALRPLIYRLRRRVTTVGLTLHVVRGRGVVLEPTLPETNS